MAAPLKTTSAPRIISSSQDGILVMVPILLRLKHHYAAIANGRHHVVGRVSGWSGSRESHFAPREGHLDHGQFDHGRHFDHEHDHFDHRFVRNRFFFAGGGWPYYYDYGYDCGGLRRQAAITGSPYWWSRYNACVGYY